MRVICALVLIGAVAACGDETEPPDEQGPVVQGGEASGDVLGGTIRDDMIDLESLTSRSPPARSTPSGEPIETVDNATSGEEPAAQELPTPAPPAMSEEGAAPEEAAPSR